MLLHQESVHYLTAIWKFMATVIVFCEQEREQKAPLIHLVCGGAENRKISSSPVFGFVTWSACSHIPLSFLFLSSSRILLIACVQQQCPPRACRPPQ